MDDTRLLDGLTELFLCKLGAIDYRVFIAILIVHCECLVSGDAPVISLQELSKSALVKTVSATCRSVKRLERYGLIQQVSHGGGRGRYSAYTVTGLV